MALYHDGPVDGLDKDFGIPGWGVAADWPRAQPKPDGWQYGIMWFHLGEDTSNLTSGDAARPWRYGNNLSIYTGNQSTNTRIQARDLQMWFLLPNGQWQLGTHNVTPGNTMYPINWSELDILGNNTWRSESGNGGGASLKDVGKGAYEHYLWHAFTGTTPEPSAYLGYVCAYYARLILDDPEGVDDRATCRILAATGGDYYRDEATLSGLKIPGVNVVDRGFSRFKYITNDWQLFAMYSTNILSEATLRANPPPLYGLQLLDEDPTDPNPGFTPLTVPSVGLWFGKEVSGENAWNIHEAPATPIATEGVPPILRKSKKRRRS